MGRVGSGSGGGGGGGDDKGNSSDFRVTALISVLVVSFGVILFITPAYCDPCSRIMSVFCGSPHYKRVSLGFIV